MQFKVIYHFWGVGELSGSMATSSKGEIKIEKIEICWQLRLDSYLNLILLTALC